MNKESKIVQGEIMVDIPLTVFAMAIGALIHVIRSSVSDPV